MIRERDVEHRLSSLAQEQGWACEKFVPDLHPGMPDRLLLLPDGRCAWVELKTQGGKLSPLQEYTHRALRDKGQDVYVVWTKEQAEETIEEIKKSLSAKC